MVDLAGDEMCRKYALVNDQAQYCGDYTKREELVEMYLTNQWRANLSVTGADGFPQIKMAGNVVRNTTGVRLSMRLPPTCDPAKAQAAIDKCLTENVPYNAKVTL